MKNYVKKSILFIICIMFFASCGKAKMPPEEVAIGYLENNLMYNFAQSDLYSAISQKSLLEIQVKASAKRQDVAVEEVLGSLGNFYNFEPNGIESYLNGYSEYKIKENESQYGSDYKIVATAINASELTDEEISEMISSALEQYETKGMNISKLYDFSSIKECHKVKCKVYAKSGEQEENFSEISVYVVNNNGEYKVLNIGEAK